MTDTFPLSALPKTTHLAAKVTFIAGGRPLTQYAKEMLSRIEAFERKNPSVDIFDDRVSESIQLHNVLIRREWSLQYLIGEYAMLPGGDYETILN